MFGLQSQELQNEVTDDLGDVSDAFQENFFEALKQKGIENYDLAYEALQKAEKGANGDADQLAVVYFEMGKNLKHLKLYEEAKSYFLRVFDSQGSRLDVMEALYDLYYLQKDYASAIPLVQQLIKEDEDYKEDLANLYHRTQQYDKAIEILDELDESWGESSYRDALRRQIYKVTGDSEGAIDNLETKIDRNPKNEQDYLNLIYLYSEQGNGKKAFETAKELLVHIPDSKLAHLALYKFYLDEGNAEEAMRSMNTVFSTPSIDNESKYRVLSDFLNFVSTHPGYEKHLETVLDSFGGQNTGKAYEQLGDYYLSKGETQTALRFYMGGAGKDPDNFSLIKSTLLLQIDVKMYDAAAELSQSSLEIFPAQPLIYLLNGVANNQLGNSDEAIENLLIGVDFVFEDPKMERDFYDQLRLGFTAKGDQKNAELFSKKAADIKLSN